MPIVVRIIGLLLAALGSALGTWLVFSNVAQSAPWPLRVVYAVALGAVAWVCFVVGYEHADADSDDDSDEDDPPTSSRPLIVGA